MHRFDRTFVDFDPQVEILEDYIRIVIPNLFYGAKGMEELYTDFQNHFELNIYLNESKNNTIQFNFTEETDKENDVDVEEVEMKKASCSMTQQSPMRDFNCEDFFVKHLLNFVDTEELSEQDILELRKLLDKIEK